MNKHESVLFRYHSITRIDGLRARPCKRRRAEYNAAALNRKENQISEEHRIHAFAKHQYTRSSVTNPAHNPLLPLPPFPIIRHISRGSLVTSLAAPVAPLYTALHLFQLLLKVLDTVHLVSRLGKTTVWLRALLTQHEYSQDPCSAGHAPRSVSAPIV